MAVGKKSHIQLNIILDNKWEYNITSLYLSIKKKVLDVDSQMIKIQDQGSLSF
jgi:hypothetical protein